MATRVTAIEAGSHSLSGGGACGVKSAGFFPWGHIKPLHWECHFTACRDPWPFGLTVTQDTKVQPGVLGSPRG